MTERAIVFGPVGGRKIIDVRVDFGGRNGPKIDENGGSKTYRNQRAFRKRFSTILEPIWGPKTLPKIVKNR